MRLLTSWSAAGTGTVTSAPQRVENLPVSQRYKTDARFILVVTATGGTPTFDVTLVKNVDGEEVLLGTFAQKTGTGNETIVVANCPTDIEIKSVIGGTTPSITAKLYVVD